MQCEDCGRRISLDVPDFRWSKWLQLSHFLHFLFTEETITEATYEDIEQALLLLKPNVDIALGEREWRVTESLGNGYSIDTEPRTDAGHAFLFYEQADALHEYMHRREK